MMRISRGSGCKICCMRRGCLIPTLDCFPIHPNDVHTLFPTDRAPETALADDERRLSGKLSAQVREGAHKKAAFRDLLLGPALGSRRGKVRTGRMMQSMAETSSAAGKVVYMSESKVFAREQTDMGVMIEKRQRMPLVKTRDFSLVAK